jgi:hypothetical protein
MLNQLAVLPTGEPVRRANPKRPAASCEQQPNLAVGKLLTRRRLPGHGSNPIETKQPGFCAQPTYPSGVCAVE